MPLYRYIDIPKKTHFFCPFARRILHRGNGTGASASWETIVLPYKYQVAETEEASFYHIKAVEQTAEGPMLLLELIDPTVEGNASAYTPVVFKRQNDAVTAVNVNGENVTVKKTSGSYTKTTAEGWTLVGVM